MANILATVNLEAAKEGLRARHIEQKTVSGYLSKVKNMGEVLAAHYEVTPSSDDDPFVRDEDNKLQFHPGTRIYKLQLPMSEKVMTDLFTLLTLKKMEPAGKRRRSAGGAAIQSNDSDEEEEEEDNDGMTEEAADVDISDPAESYATMSTGTFNGYQAALKWWHAHSSTTMEKEFAKYDTSCDCKLRVLKRGYKKSVGRKKQVGVMKLREGKENISYDFFGRLHKKH